MIIVREWTMDALDKRVNEMLKRGYETVTEVKQESGWQGRVVYAQALKRKKPLN